MEQRESQRRVAFKTGRLGVPVGAVAEQASGLVDGRSRKPRRPVGGVSLDDKDDSLAAVLLDLQQGYAMQASESIAGNVLKALGPPGSDPSAAMLSAPTSSCCVRQMCPRSWWKPVHHQPGGRNRLRDDGHRRELAIAVLGGVRNYFESMPPPGTWFAAQAARRNGTSLASTAVSAQAAPAVAADASAVSSDAVKPLPVFRRRKRRWPGPILRRRRRRSQAVAPTKRPRPAPGQSR